MNVFIYLFVYLYFGKGVGKGCFPRHVDRTLCTQSPKHAES